MASYFEIEQEGKISEIYEFEFYSPSGETDVTINANSSSVKILQLVMLNH